MTGETCTWGGLLAALTPTLLFIAAAILLRRRPHRKDPKR